MIKSAVKRHQTVPFLSEDLEKLLCTHTYIRICRNTENYIKNQVNRVHNPRDSSIEMEVHGEHF